MDILLLPFLEHYLLHCTFLKGDDNDDDCECVCVCVCMCTCMHMCVCVCVCVSHFWTAVLNFHCYLQLLHFFINCFTVGCDHIFAFSVMSCNCCNGEMAPKRIHHYKKWTLSAWVILASSIPSSTK